jgi:hypothetical protein
VSAFDTASGPIGPDGPQGDPGATGATGSAGAPGAVGPSGADFLAFDEPPQTPGSNDTILEFPPGGGTFGDGVTHFLVSLAVWQRDALGATTSETRSGLFFVTITAFPTVNGANCTVAQIGGFVASAAPLVGWGGTTNVTGQAFGTPGAWRLKLNCAGPVLSQSPHGCAWAAQALQTPTLYRAI